MSLRRVHNYWQDCTVVLPEIYPYNFTLRIPSENFDTAALVIRCEWCLERFRDVNDIEEKAKRIYADLQMYVWNLYL